MKSPQYANNNLLSAPLAQRQRKQRNAETQSSRAAGFSLSLPHVLQEQVCFSRGQTPQLSASCGPPQQKAACLALCYFPQSPYLSLSRWFKERERDGTFKETQVWLKECLTSSLSITITVVQSDVFFFSWSVELWGVIIP